MQAILAAPQLLWVAAVLEQLIENGIVLAREADQQMDLGANSSKVRPRARGKGRGWLPHLCRHFCSSELVTPASLGWTVSGSLAPSMTHLCCCNCAVFIVGTPACCCPPANIFVHAQYNALATALQGCAHELGGVQRAEDIGRWRGNLTVLIMLTKVRVATQRGERLRRHTHCMHAGCWALMNLGSLSSAYLAQL